MGGNCCVAARNKPLPSNTRFEVSTYRNVRYSPSWSFRWDNRTHTEDMVDNAAQFSHNTGNTGSENRSLAGTETEGLSNGGSPYSAFQKSPIRTRTARNSSTADHRIGSSSSPPHENETIKSSATASSSMTKASIYTPPSAFSLDSSLSGSRIPSLKSLNENSSPEARQSFVLNDGSSDGWSMRAFTELVASSQRERWSFDSENSYSIKSRMTRSSTKKQPSLSIDVETCGVCSQLLKERDPRITKNTLSVVSVLACGHLYHADCLEGVTRETDRFDPKCPTCTNGERSEPPRVKRSEPPKVKSKLSRIAVADVDSISECEQREIPKSARMGASSSMKSSFGRPFLRRHFSFGSRSILEVEPSRKKSGFWARHRRG